MINSTSNINTDISFIFAETLLRWSTLIFQAVGADLDHATLVAQELVDTSLMGIDSHGILRIPQYVEDTRAGRINPGANIRIVKETCSTAVIDADHHFGAVSASHMCDVILDKARDQPIVTAVSHHCEHVGRLGSWVERLARQGLVALGFVSSSNVGHFVVPFGGTEGRLATNPFAYAVPTSGPDPILLDISTSATPEGKIRAMMHAGKQMPPQTIQNARGQSITDPACFYGPPRGTILPFGADQGYKGFGLSLLVEILGSTLAGMASDIEQPYLNGLCLIAIDPDAFAGRTVFTNLVDRLAAYQTSSKPIDNARPVVMPGHFEYQTKRHRLVQGIPVPNSVRRSIFSVAEQVNVSLKDDR